MTVTLEVSPITVRKSLEKVPGVRLVKVDFDKEDGHRHLRPGPGPGGGADRGDDAGRLPFHRPQLSVPAAAVVLESVLTCPRCDFAKRETMPTDACQLFYECSNCHALLRPKRGDCCVFCSFGSMACPPVQARRGE